MGGTLTPPRPATPTLGGPPPRLRIGVPTLSRVAPKFRNPYKIGIYGEYVLTAPGAVVVLVEWIKEGLMEDGSNTGWAADLAEIERLRALNGELLALVKRWGALDGGAWNAVRYADDKAELKQDTAALIAECKADGWDE